MSLFQCSKCGCIENSACTRCYHCMGLLDDAPEAALSYKKILGLKPDEPFGRYCSACCPVWFDGRKYGIGPNPRPTADKYDGGGLWHGEFKRTYLPKGQFEKDPHGNIRKQDAHDEDIEKYKRDTEYD